MHSRFFHHNRPVMYVWLHSQRGHFWGSLPAIVLIKRTNLQLLDEQKSPSHQQATLEDTWGLLNCDWESYKTNHTWWGILWHAGKSSAEFLLRMLDNITVVIQRRAASWRHFRAFWKDVRTAKMVFQNSVVSFLLEMSMRCFLIM